MRVTCATIAGMFFALAGLTAGCAPADPAPFGPAHPAAFDEVQRRSEAAHELRRLTHVGDFAAAHAVADGQADSTDDPADALWWKCQHLYIYTYEDRPAARRALAGDLAEHAAAGEPAFLFSTALPELVRALAEGGRDESAHAVLLRRYRALLAIEPRGLWWHHRMAETASLARGVGDANLARAAGAQVDLPEGDPYRELVDPPPASKPIEPKQ